MSRQPLLAVFPWSPKETLAGGFLFFISTTLKFLLFAGFAGAAFFEGVVHEGNDRGDVLLIILFIIWYRKSLQNMRLKKRLAELSPLTSTANNPPEIRPSWAASSP